ncbi:hypothetical protein E4U41_001226 [Claviceps citrina]|nr:hypothetical protein E4U41_001226 [Claviceps citrina]
MSEPAHQHLIDGRLLPTIRWPEALDEVKTKAGVVAVAPQLARWAQFGSLTAGQCLAIRSAVPQAWSHDPRCPRCQMSWAVP